MQHAYRLYSLPKKQPHNEELRIQASSSTISGIWKDLDSIWQLRRQVFLVGLEFSLLFFFFPQLFQPQILVSDSTLVPVWGMGKPINQSFQGILNQMNLELEFTSRPKQELNTFSP